MGNRAAVDLTKGKLTEDELLTTATALSEMIQTQGWQYLLQLIVSSKYALMQMIHEPATSKDYLSGLLKAIDTIPDNVAYIVERGDEIRKQRIDEREAAVSKAVLPFTKPGGSTPAN